MMKKEAHKISKARLIVVEDEALVALDLKNRLTRMSYEVADITAYGELAVIKCQVLKPDIVLMDIKLAGKVEGVEAADNIRRELDIPVIFLTGNSDEQTIERAKFAQPYGFLTKPFNERELQAAIETALYRHTTEKRIRESELRYRYLVEHCSDIIYSTDRKGCFTYYNRAVGAILGYSDEELLGRHFSELVAETHRQTAKDHYRRQFKERIAATYLELPVLAKDGSIVWLGQHVRIERNEETVSGLQAVARDITAKKFAEEELKAYAEQLASTNEQLSRLAITDEMTGLLNRRGFFIVANQHIQFGRRMEKEFLLTFIDLDSLKKINDRFGHQVGDEMIGLTARIIRDIFRASDVIARYGGDEFVVLSAVRDGTNDSAVISRRITDKLTQFNADSNCGYQISFSFGISRLELEKDESLEEFVRRADQAMYEQKTRRLKNARH